MIGLVISANLCIFLFDTDRSTSFTHKVAQVPMLSTGRIIASLGISISAVFRFARVFSIYIAIEGRQTPPPRVPS
jgi:hypothetical protein